MDSPVVSSGRGEKKRSLSRRSSTTETNPDTVSVGSQKTSSLANYRYNNLNYARIVVEGELIPKDIASRIDAIIQPEISSEKRDELFLAAETLCNDFAKIIVESSREDDSVELMYHALACIDKDKKFAFPRKAGTLIFFHKSILRSAHVIADFDPNLKPIIQRKVLQWNISTDNSTEDFPTRLAKRQQPDAACVSPANSDPSIMRPVAASIPVPPQGPETIMAPPPLPSRPDISAVKNPRPDITVGLSARIVIDKLIARGFSDFDAEEALVALQKQLTFSLSALQPAFKMLFPPMVVEGKSYSTGKPIFEAENQAAVSGSCMCNQQYKLAEFTELVSCVPRGSRVPPLAFSICTEGPVLELWAHYATSVRDIRTYNMNILKICRVSRRPALQKEVAGFLEAVYGIMEWASTEFLDGVVEQLVLLWDAGQ